jgi:uncharacterized protein (DUF849 family)
MNKVIVTAAITGSIHTPSMSPHLPITPGQIAEEAIKVFEAGGTVAHIHVRDPESGVPTADQEAYREIAAKVKKRCDLILCFTTGGRLGEPVEKRLKVVSTLKPELSSLNAGSLNFALFHVADKVNTWKFPWEKEYLEATEDFIFPNTFRTMRQYLSVMNENETKPEFEIYDVGMINNVAFLIEAGHVKKPVYLQFVMGILGGIAATPQNLNFLVESARSVIGDFEFSVCAAGKMQFPLCTQSLILGGHVRVGLEDNLYLEKGVMAKSNAEQVAKIIRIARELGLEPASPAEGRNILSLKGLERVNY